VDFAAAADAFADAARVPGVTPDRVRALRGILRGHRMHFTANCSEGVLNVELTASEQLLARVPRIVELMAPPKGPRGPAEHPLDAARLDE
jgi:hypothetical protein